MRPEDIRAFARRDWARVQRAKIAHWIREYEEKASGPSLRAADALRAHVARFAPTALQAERASDLEDLLRLKGRIDAANAGLQRRGVKCLDQGSLRGAGRGRRAGGPA